MTIIQLKFCRNWPPTPAKKNFVKNNKVIVEEDLVCIDYYGNDWDAKQSALQVTQQIQILIEKKSKMIKQLL